MTEAEWLACTDPYKMLAFLGDKVSDRKQWLTACACCRNIPGFLASDAGRSCLEVVERFAEGAATEEELVALHEDDWDMRWYRNWPGSSLGRAITTYHDAHWDMLPAGATREERTEAVSRAMAEVTGLVRELFSNLFRLTTLDPSWLTWHDGLLVSMARQMYDSRDFTDMPILADALEEAGCTDQDILGHCRSGREHVRGCWVVDLVLGKS
ncbi:MAG TPA: hypothetical protein VH575_36875 [Gemmataceae bacterium]|jgi:hypothetical protein